ncbi:MAG: TonB family protein, partial [Pedosphaera sp.]|nr:TonB family protein [Pedosphaera sp.]
MDASQRYAGHKLKSELARYCLPGAKRDSNRKLAWVNSICILFLLIGIAGSKPATINIKTPPPIEEVIPTIIEPLPPPPTRIEAQQNPEPTDQAKPEAPAVVVVTPESPAINFSVPTIGRLVVPNAIATAPPANPLRPLTPARNDPTSIGDTGKGGDRPKPDRYPELARKLHQEGVVTLLLTVDERGLITEIKVAASS